MRQIEAPGTRSEHAGANNGTDKYTQSGNDMQISFGHHQRRVYNFLLQGGAPFGSGYFRGAKVVRSPQLDT